MSQAPRIYYSPDYELDLGGHVWPTSKYRLIAETLVRAGVVENGGFGAPALCAWDDLALVHTPEYLRKVRTLSKPDALAIPPMFVPVAV